MRRSVRASALLEHQVARAPRFVLGAVLAIVVLGWFDRLTGPLVSFQPMYAIPVCAVAWFVGRRQALALIAAAIAVALLADWRAYTEWGPWITIWNVIARAVILSVMVLLLAAVRSRLDASRLRAEAEHQAAQDLRAADELKTTFLAAVSHELRTPLAAILGSSRTLEDLGGVLDEADRLALLAAISRNAVKLDRLLGDLLDLDRLQRGATTLERRSADLAKVVQGALEDFPVPEGSTLHLSAASVPVEVDVAKVERIVENLVSNALKYAPGRVSVTVGSARPGVAAIVVEDEGPGVPSAERERVFETFQRGGRDSSKPGVGLGLALVRSFAQLHGGTARVEERPGGGARFVVDLPANPDQPAPPSADLVGARARA